MKALLTRFFLFTGIFNAATAQEIDYKGFPQWSWHKQDSTEYYLYTPSNMKSGKKYPVALFMHGCCGTSYKASLRNAVDPPVRMWHNFGQNTQAVPTYIIAPATSQGWRQHFRNIKKVIDDLIASGNADPQRVYVTGFSMGGDGTFGIIQEYPGFFAAALPMGMGFRGDSTLVKDIPIWTSQGETDWFARNLKKNVSDIRRLNGYIADTGATWITGVNPRYSSFRGVGHGVQWKATSTQDLTGWAYSKVNDGNQYPVVFFENPLYNKTFTERSKVKLQIYASDPDGYISKVLIYQNKELRKTLKRPPYFVRLKLKKGDNLIEAVSLDDKEKSAVATTVIKVNILPEILDEKLPFAIAGEYYVHKLRGRGNGELRYSSGKTPGNIGITVYPDGTLKGYPVESGTSDLTVNLSDADGETTSEIFRLEVKPPNPGIVIINNIRTADGNSYPVRRIQPGEAPFYNSSDSVISTETEEINFSGLGKYEGLYFIQTDVNDAQKNAQNFLQFDISQEATVYIAYEKLDHTKSSSIPEWLKKFKKEEGEIVAQYRYFDVYSKIFPRGLVSIPAADAKSNGVGSNYFVIVSRK